jgi:tetratricopeptide (TPR) repeat protein
MSAQAVGTKKSPRGLLVAILMLTLLVMVLGGAVIAVKLRPEPLPTNTVERRVAAWEQAVADDPEDTNARTGLGLALLEAGRRSEAQEAFEQAVELYPRNPVALLQLALLVQGSNPEQAVSLLERAVKHAPRTQKAAAAIALGDLLMNQQDPEGAVKAYRIAVADGPYLLEAHWGLATAFEAVGEPERALDEYRYAQRFAPDDPALAEAIDRLEAAT